MPGKSHGWRSLIGCSSWSRYKLDTTEWLYFHFSLSCIGEGNGKPLQCSCLENPRDRGAWWAAVYGVTQSRTRLKRLSSSDKFHWACFHMLICHVYIFSTKISVWIFFLLWIEWFVFLFLNSECFLYIWWLLLNCNYNRQWNLHPRSYQESLTHSLGDLLRIL